MHVGSRAPGSSPDGRKAQISLCAAAADTLRAAAAAAHPHEACGLLFGAPAEVRHASIATNVSADPTRRFEIDPQHLFDAQRSSRTGPDRLIGCWHSHPNGNPRPSRHDLAGITDPGWIWLIVAHGAITAWRPGTAGFTEVALEVGRQ